MYKYGLIVLLGVLMNIPVIAAGSVSEYPKELFLLEARRRVEMQSSFADLRGIVTHLRKNQGGAVYFPIQLLIVFQREDVKAKVVIGNDEEHKFKQNNRTRKTVTSCNKELSESLLSKVGIRIEDLTMSFLDYPVTREFPRETVKTISCRVLELLSPEGEVIKIWVAAEYLFPVKVEFYGANNHKNSKPVRSLEITGFKKVGNYYVVTDIALSSLEYRTKIVFSDCEVLPADDPRAAREFNP